LDLAGKQSILVTVDHRACVVFIDLGEIREMDPVECAQTDVCDQNVGPANIQLVTRSGEVAQSKYPETGRGDDGREFRHKDRIGIDDQRAEWLMCDQCGRHILAELVADVNSIRALRST